MRRLGGLQRIAERRAPHLVLELRRREHLRHGEPHLRWLRHLCRGGVAVDVGANLGVYTAELARWSRHVIAVEPNPACAARLQRAAPSNVTVVVAAAGAVTGTSELYVPTDPDRHFRSSLAREIAAQGGPVRAIRCPVIRIDDLTAERIDFIKIDVEGAEDLALSGARRKLMSDRPTLLIEADEAIKAGANERIRQFAAALDYVELSSLSLRPTRWSNIMFVPREREGAGRDAIATGA